MNMAVPVYRHGPPHVRNDSSYFDEESGRRIIKGPVVFPAGLPKLGNRWPTIPIPNPNPTPQP